MTIFFYVLTEQANGLRIYSLQCLKLLVRNNRKKPQKTGTHSKTEKKLEVMEQF